MKNLIFICLALLLPLTAAAERKTFYDEESRLYFAYETGTSSCEVIARPGGYTYPYGNYTVPWVIVVGQSAYFVTAIGEGAFKNNGPDMMASLTIDLSQCYQLTEIKKSAFCYSGLRSLVWPTDNNVTAIGDSAFYYCDKLAEMELPPKLQRIAPHCFNQCTSITQITIPDAVKTIGHHAFYGCKGIKTINFGSQVYEIEESAFMNCGAIKNYNLPNSLITIGSYAFYGPLSLDASYHANLTMGSNLRTIGAHAFQKCHFETVTIPDGVETIGDYAFCANKVGAYGAITKVILGKAVTYIGHNAFAENNTLANVTVANRELLTGVENDSFVLNPSGRTLHVPADFLQLYNNSTLWKRFFINIVGDGPDVTYPLWVGETRITTANRNQIPVSSGSASFDPVTNVLKLNSATINTNYQGDYCIGNGNPDRYIKGIDGLTITVNGQCRLTAVDNALVVGSNTIINGTGTLNINSTENAIYVGANSELTCNVGVIWATATKEVVCGEAASSRLVINGGTMKLIPKSSNFCTVSGLGGFTLTDCKYHDPGGEWKYADAASFAYNTSTRRMMFGNEIYKKTVLIRPATDPVYYRLTVGQVTVTSKNKDDIPGGSYGKASYDPVTHTLTLNNFEMGSNYQGEFGIGNGFSDMGLEGIPDLRIVVNGNCALYTADAAIHINGGTTVISGGNLDLESSVMDAISLGSNTTLQVNSTNIWATSRMGNVICGHGDNTSIVRLNAARLTAVAPDNEQYNTINHLSDFELNGCYFNSMGTYDAHGFAFDANKHCVTYNGVPYRDRVVISTTPPPPPIPTAINTPEADETNADIYTLDGRRLNAQPLRHGIYIKNGKKIVK